MSEELSVIDAEAFKSDTAGYAFLWNKFEIETLNDVERLPIKELNESLVKVLEIALSEQPITGLFDANGFDPQAQRLLGLIEERFSENSTDTGTSIENLSTTDRLLLATGLALKMFSKARISTNNKVLIETDPSVGGVTFERVSHSRKDKLMFYFQQHEKYTFQFDTTEPVDFFLLHTYLKEDGNTGGGITLYEQRQTQNLQEARLFLQKLDSEKVGDHTLEDIEMLARTVLKGIIPPREDVYRHNQAQVRGRKPFAAPEEIKDNLIELLLITKGIKKYVLEHSWLVDTDDEWLKKHPDIPDVRNSTDYKKYTGEKEHIENLVLAALVCFDAIHPFSEGNGRVGWLLFESWYRTIMREQVEFNTKWGDMPRLVAAMTDVYPDDPWEPFDLMGKNHRRENFFIILEKIRLQAESSNPFRSLVLSFKKPLNVLN